MKKYLVTGGAGFIGSAVASELLHQGSEVVIIDNLSTGCIQNVPIGVKFIEGNCEDENVVSKHHDDIWEKCRQCRVKQNPHLRRTDHCPTKSVVSLHKNRGDIQERAGDAVVEQYTEPVVMRQAN